MKKNCLPQAMRQAVFFGHDDKMKPADERRVFILRQQKRCVKTAALDLSVLPSSFVAKRRDRPIKILLDNLHSAVIAAHGAGALALVVSGLAA